jgi:hypothetical protein
VVWLAALILAFVVIGIRARMLRGSTHVMILMAAAVALGVLLLQPVKPQ